MSTNRNVIRSPTSSPERPAESTDRDDRPSGTRRRRSSSEARHRESLKYWLEKKQRLQGGSGSDGPASIVTSGDEVPEVDPTDSTYRGRSSVRSRIGSVQAERDRGSPIQTRRSGRHPSSSAADTAAAPASPSKEDNNDDGSVPRGLSPAITPPPPFVHPPLPSKSRSRSKRVKSAATTPSVHDDVKRTPSSSAKRRRIFSKKAGARASRRPAAKRPRLEPKPFPLSPSPSDDDLPTTLEGMKARLAEVWKKRPAPRMSLSPSPPPPTRLFKKPDYNIKFFDDEAVEEEESDASASDMVPDGDEYDLEDPFIDDTAFIEDTDVSMDSDGYAGRARLTPVDNERDDYSSDRDTRPLRGPLPADDDIWRYADGTPYIPESDVSMDSDGNPFVKERDYMFKEETPSSRKGATNLSHRSNNRGGSSSSKKPSPRYRDDRRSRAHRASSPPKRTARPVHYRRSAEKNGGRRRQVAEHGDIKKDVVEISSDSEGNVVERSSSRGPSTKTPSSKPRPRPIPKALKGKERAPLPLFGDGEKAASSSAKNKKGKGRAIMHSPSPPPMVEVKGESEDDEDGLSPYERAQLREAIAESKKLANHRTHGEPSSSSSSPGAGPSTASSSAGPHTASAGSSETAAASPSPSSSAAIAGPSPAGSTAGTGPAGPSLPSSSSAPISMQDLVAQSLAAANGTAGDAAPAAPQPIAAPPPADPTFLRRCRESDLPSVDEVMHRSLQDPVLIACYEGLLCLRSGTLIPWTDTPGRGFINFSAWAEWLPKMNGGNAFAAVNFRQVGTIRNPARASPVDIGLRVLPGSGQRYNMYCATNPPEPLIAVSCGWLERSQLTAYSGTGLPQKFVNVILHSQEFQRTTGFIRMASGYPELHAQFARNALQFSTRAQAQHGPSSPGDSPTGKRPAPSSMFRATADPAPTAAARVAADSFSLPNDAVVPVYDAREVNSLDFDAVLPRLAESLPTYTGGEIPYGSFVVVGYTMTIYRANNGNMTLGCNLQWVILLGAPEN